ncbi:hypothetical protein A9G12_06585 [Gilliamella sp. wkB112]|nr:hypothetical protein A9G12_06585 [Gilliamella apicola]
MLLTAPFYQYWGKCHQGDQTACYHLLAYHNLDVAACGYQLVKHNYFNSAELFEQIGFQTDENEKAASWFAYFLAWHDIGKFANGFQQLFKHNFPQLIAADHSKQYLTRHDSLGFWLWRDFLINQNEIFFDNYDEKIDSTLDTWLLIMTGHHGKPPELQNVYGSLAFTKQDKQASLAYLKAINQLFLTEHKLEQYPPYFFDKKLRKKFKRVSWLFAAITVISDWLGSNEQYFPFCSEIMPLSEYWYKHAMPQAEKAIATLPKSSPMIPFKDIATLFPFIEKPTPLQQHALSCPITDKGAELFILEDVTGAGKTEASMILAHRLMSAQKARGIYIALPTMATANAIYQRMASVYGQLYQADNHPSLVLAHGASHMNPHFNQSILTKDDNSQQQYKNDEPSIIAECNEWFVDSRKKSLLAEVGVGTLDQALIAVLPFKHQTLRLLGLQHKLLILDEIHAYDSYMIKLLEILLNYHAMQGGSAIILTATLPTFLRDKLLNAFYQGLTASNEGLTINQQAPFPLMTQLNHNGLIEQALPTRDEVKRQVKIDWITDIDSGIDKIKQTIQQGKIICWIKNSVQDAIDLYQQLQLKLNLDTDSILLFHSRFAFCDRLAIEEKTLYWAGKTSNHDIRHGKVIIATQVIEQSLDLDFDEMISDIAPIDLLIQRAGRLQRHVRDQQGNIKPSDKHIQANDDRGQPIITILAPIWQDNPNEDWLNSPIFRNTSYVYSNHALLWLTQQTLKQLGYIKMPEDARLLIESVYNQEIEPPSGLQNSFYDAEGKKLSQASIAEHNTLNFENGYCRGSHDIWQNNMEISTRLTSDNVDIYLAYIEQDTIMPYSTNSNYAWEQSRLTLNKRKWLKVERNIPQLDENRLEKLRKQIHRPNAIIILIEKDKTALFYSKELGFYAN